MKKLLFVILALTLCAGLWADEKITLTAADFTVTKDGVGIDKEKETAINEIKGIATNAKNKIDALGVYPPVTDQAKEEIDRAVAEAEASITNADSEKQVNDAKNNAFNEIKKQLASVQAYYERLQAAKQAAHEAIDKATAPLEVAINKAAEGYENIEPVKIIKAQIAEGLYETHQIIDADTDVENIEEFIQMFIPRINIQQKLYVKDIQDAITDFTTSQGNAINEVKQAAATAKEKINGLGVDVYTKGERKGQIDNIVSTAKANINNATNTSMINYANEQAIADINNVVQTTKDMWVTVRTDGTAGNWNTICLERNITAIDGATFWTVSGQDETSFILDEVTEPQAGQGYLIRFTATELKVKYGDQKVTEPATATKDNPIQGTFTQIDFDQYGQNVLVDNYVVYNNKLCPVVAWVGMREHRAYVVKDLVPNTEPQYAPSRARAYMPKPDQTPTELKSVDGSQRTIHNGKLLRNGQLIIVKDNKMYNVQGMKL